MSTSVKTLRTDAMRYLAAALGTALFGAVYEAFGRGVWSFYMVYAFAVPLLLGLLPNLLLLGRREETCPDDPTDTNERKHIRLRAIDVSRNLWASGVATLTVGCIFRGALEIFGTTNGLTVVYPIAGGILLLAGAASFLRAKR